TLTCIAQHLNLREVSKQLLLCAVISAVDRQGQTTCDCASSLDPYGLATSCLSCAKGVYHRIGPSLSRHPRPRHPSLQPPTPHLHPSSSPSSASPPMSLLSEGARVRLVGLTARPALNGAEGVVVAAPQGDPPRYPVRLLHPPEAVAAHPEGVKVKRDNLEIDADRSAAGKQDTSKDKSAPKQQQPAAGKAKNSGKSGADQILSPQIRLATCRKTAEIFLDALDADAYPAEAMEGIFGVRMNCAGGQRKVDSDLSTWPMGNLTFGAWITIRNWFFEDRMMAAYELGPDEQDKLQEMAKRAAAEFVEEIARVLVQGRMPQWYEEQLRKLQREGRQSYYVMEIVRRKF
ncbi:hypothetical protein Agub_g11101, partial [Astrephomene gubernaculifera]